MNTGQPSKNMRGRVGKEDCNKKIETYVYSRITFMQLYKNDVCVYNNKLFNA